MKVREKDRQRQIGRQKENFLAPAGLAGCRGQHSPGTGAFLVAWPKSDGRWLLLQWKEHELWGQTYLGSNSNSVWLWHKYLTSLSCTVSPLKGDNTTSFTSTIGLMIFILTKVFGRKLHELTDLCKVASTMASNQYELNKWQPGLEWITPSTARACILLGHL